MRLNVACPAAWADDANDLAMVLAEGPPDGLTYSNLNWQDAQGNLYCAASFEIGPTFISKATSPLVRPAWDTNRYVNMAGANRAQALIRLVFEPQPATPEVILTLTGDDALGSLTAMGLTLVEQML